MAVEPKNRHLSQKLFYEGTEFVVTAITEWGCEL